MGEALACISDINIEVYYQIPFHHSAAVIFTMRPT